MKIAVITMYQGNNYGGALQVYAMEKTLEDMGHQVDIINYTPWRFRDENIVREGVRLNPILTHNIILSTIYRVSAWMSGYRNCQVFKEFYKRELALTKEYTEEELYKGYPDADIYMTGSDQVWCNKEEYKKVDSIYYLDFVSEGKRKISYASSIGKDHLSEWEIPEMKRMLSGYTAIAVREDRGVELLEGIGLSGIKQTLDPTLLLNKEQWEKIMKSPKRKIKGKYVLVYELGISRQTTQFAHKLAGKQGLKVIQVSPALYAIAKRGRFIFCPEVFEFLWLMDHAEYVVTDSFHGVAFSINFNKQFYVARPMHNSSRIDSLLRLTGLQDRQVDMSRELHHKIDYVLVNRKINEARKQSMEYLSAALLGETDD